METLRLLAGPNKPIEVRCVAADTLALLTNNKDRIAELEVCSWHHVHELSYV